MLDARTLIDIEGTDSGMGEVRVARRMRWRCVVAGHIARVNFACLTMLA